MGRLINIGYGNVVNTDRIVTVISPDSAPVKRMIQGAKDKGTAVDATQGRRTRSVIITDSVYIILSALMPDTIANRFQGNDQYRNKNCEIHTEYNTLRNECEDEE